MSFSQNMSEPPGAIKFIAPCLLVFILALATFLLTTSSILSSTAVAGETIENEGMNIPSTSTTGQIAFMSPHSRPVVIHGNLVYVTNTPAATVDIFDKQSIQLVYRVHVGIEPVGLALRPDGSELWVANHLSDSISVIDTNSSSPTYLNIVATIQALDEKTRATRFDEPVGIAFANNQKAYVTLSSENQIAVIDAVTKRITGRLSIPAQDPRSIVVRGNRLYVTPFESNNQTQLSGGTKEQIDHKLITFDAVDHSVVNNNVLSLGHVVDIVKHPRVPDRDLFIFNTETDELLSTSNTLGTLLYGLAVDSEGTAYIAQTDARNDVNGRAGTQKHGLAQLENRAFLNRITKVTSPEAAESKVSFIDLEPLPPTDPSPGEALATPSAIEVSPDDSILVATAASSNMLFTVEAATGKVLGRVLVEAVPEGLALEIEGQSKLVRAWVLNAASNSVSIVDLSKVDEPKLLQNVPLQDPTHPAIKRGRIAFSSAAASTSGTYSCASCHPDGHTDHLLWVLDTPIVSGGNQIMPRSTMPVRGLRDTAPFHWDGIPGDPYGGPNSAHVFDQVPPNSEVNRPESSTRHLIDGGLASTMMRVGSHETNDEGKLGKLSAQERDDMAMFLLSIPYPPAQRRAYDDQLSTAAKTGFKLFHIDGDNDPKQSTPNRCGDCHRLPFLVSTNTPGSGMDAPTWRGAYDRWLILPQGRINIIDFDFFENIAKQGIPERSLWQFSWSGRTRFDPVWDMVLEMSTGFPGAFGRQVTLNKNTAQESQALHLVSALEQAARDKKIVLQARGVLIDDIHNKNVLLQFQATANGENYIELSSKQTFKLTELIDLAAKGQFSGTFTAYLGGNFDYEHPQPALWTSGPLEKQRGRQIFPTLFPEQKTLKLSGRHITKQSTILVDGNATQGVIESDGESVSILLANLPAQGLHFLQIQNPDGLASNEFLFHVTDKNPDLNPKTRSMVGMLRQSGVQRLLGTWVDQESQGKQLKVTYQWKVKDRIIEHVNIDATSESHALIGVNKASGNIYHMGGTSVGASYSGTWAADTNGDSVLNLNIESENGERHTLNVRYHFEDEDHFNLILELPQPIVIKMVRAKP
jgi:DNA-binding beta-propeller fold protein YncE